MGLFAGTQWDLPAHCDHCGKLESDCDCLPPRPEAKSPGSQTLRVRVEKRKAGRVVTVVAGLETDSAGRAELLTRLKNVCGCGGSHEDMNLVIQGDQAARIKPLLSELGYRVK